MTALVQPDTNPPGDDGHGASGQGPQIPHHPGLDPQRRHPGRGHRHEGRPGSHPTVDPDHHAHSHRARRHPRVRLVAVARGLVDRFVGSDPGLTRLRSASLAVLGIGVALLAGYVFVRSTGALQIDTHGAVLPPAQAATVKAANHATLVLGMLFGAIMALLGSFAQDRSARGLALTTVLMPLPIVATFVAEVALTGHRLAGLAILPVALTVGTYARRWGPRGFLGGQLLFMGSFIGFLTGGAVKLGQVGWIAAELGLGALVGLVVHLVLFYPRPGRELRRSQRSWLARARRALDLALRVVDEVDPPAAERLTRRLHRQLVRLNESSLIIDAQLGTTDAVGDATLAAQLHQRLFDLELAISNVCRFAEALSRRPLEPGQRSAVRRALLALRTGEHPEAGAAAEALLTLAPGRDGGPADRARRFDDDVTTTVLTHRFARSAEDLVEAQRAWVGLGERVEDDHEDVGFEPAAMLFNGWLPGSTMVSAQAGTTPRATTGRRSLSDRIALAPYVRTAIQIGVAVTAAIAAGDALDGRRFYWAVLAAFVTFMATSNSGEQLKKAFQRLAGTAVGIVAGIVLVHYTQGHAVWSLVVVLVALFFALYLIRISYLFMVLGITIMVSQLYVQLAEYSRGLLYLRLEETAIGFGVVVLTVLLVLPLRPARVLQTAGANSVTALGEALAAATDVLVEGVSPTREARLRAAVRGVDARHQEMLAVAGPMRRMTLGTGADRVRLAVTTSVATRNYVRNLASDLGGWGGLDEGRRAEGRSAAGELQIAVQVLVDRLAEAQDGTYVRTAALFDGLPGEGAARSGGRLAVRDLALIDGTLARVAGHLGLAVSDHDTCSAGVGEPAAVTG